MRASYIIIATAVLVIIIVQSFVMMQTRPTAPDLVKTTMITMVTQQELDYLRNRVPFNDSLVVYGVNLRREHAREISGWNNVSYVDVLHLDYNTDWDVNELLGLTHMSTIDSEYGHHGYMASKWYHFWYITVLNDALETYGSILYVDPRFNVEFLPEVYMHLANNGHAMFSVDGVSRCWYKIVGILQDSEAHRRIVAPLSSCVLDRDCFTALWDKYSHGFNIPGTGDDTKYQCLSQDLVEITEVEPASKSTTKPPLPSSAPTSVPSMPSNPPLPSSVPTPAPSNAVLTIALLVPTTSRNVHAASIQDFPLFTILLQSIKETVAQDSFFKFKLYIGYDEGDIIFDGEEQQTHVKNAVDQFMAGWPLEYRALRLIGLAGAPAQCWNALAGMAYEEGCDYLFQLNDDIKLSTGGWAEMLVQQLLTSELQVNFGSTGPVDIGNPRLLTQSFVHRSHIDIFGSYYPPVLKNWYSDDWITLVYQNATITYCEAKAQNINPAGTRYAPSMEQAPLLEQTVKEGCEALKRWWNEQNRDWYCDQQKVSTGPRNPCPG